MSILKENLLKQYPVGARVELVRMSDPYTKLRPGDLGTVEFVDDMGTVFCLWDRGSGLGALYGIDTIRRVDQE